MRTTQRKPEQSSIARLVELHGGVCAFAKKLGGRIAYQEVQRWVKRGWVAPVHLMALEELLADGITLRDLYADREGRRAMSRRNQVSCHKQIIPHQ